jgi:hypothetical protein
MKKITLLFCFIPFLMFSQKNALKVNLSSLLLRNYSLSYERTLGKHTSILLNGRYMPKVAIPNNEQFRDALSLESANISELILANTAFTAEFRYYLGKKVNSGFYFAPYARTAKFEANCPIDIDITDPATNISTQNNAYFTGNFNVLSGGLLLGVQKHLSKVFILDIWLVGLQVGNMDAKANIALKPNINTILQRELTNIIEENRQNSPIDFSYSVSQDKVNMQLNTLAPGIRGLGFNLGIKF